MMRRNSCIFCILPWVLLACQAPVGPEEKSLSIRKSDDTKTVDIQLWAGRIKYAAYVGGFEWRATFEVKVVVDSAKNIRDRCEITFFWKSKATKPTVNEGGWTSSPGFFPHGLMSIDGHWLDRLPLSPPRESYWMRARVVSDRFDAVDVIGMCNFLESVELPDTTWSSADDLGYGLGKKILARAKVSESQ